MRARCPKSPDHKRFLTTAHVVEDWVVDENGDFLEKADEAIEVSAPPHPQNTWTCQECGAEAEVSDD